MLHKLWKTTDASPDYYTEQNYPSPLPKEKKKEGTFSTKKASGLPLPRQQGDRDSVRPPPERRGTNPERLLPIALQLHSRKIYQPALGFQRCMDLPVILSESTILQAECVPWKVMARDFLSLTLLA
ncbi:hypothetical protein STEG23_016550 [Scotinomys teguina]